MKKIISKNDFIRIDDSNIIKNTYYYNNIKTLFLKSKYNNINISFIENKKI